MNYGSYRRNNGQNLPNLVKHMNLQILGVPQTKKDGTKETHTKTRSSSYPLSGMGSYLLQETPSECLKP